MRVSHALRSLCLRIALCCELWPRPAAQLRSGLGARRRTSGLASCSDGPPLCLLICETGRPGSAVVSHHCTRCPRASASDFSSARPGRPSRYSLCFGEAAGGAGLQAPHFRGPSRRRPWPRRAPPRTPGPGASRSGPQGGRPSATLEPGADPDLRRSRNWARPRPGPRPRPGVGRRERGPDLRRLEKIQGGGLSLYSAPGGPQRAPGASKNDPGRKTGPGERVGTSGDRVLKKSRHRRSGWEPFSVH